MPSILTVMPSEAMPNPVDCQNFDGMAPCPDVDDRDDVVWVAVPDDAMLGLEPGAVADAEADVGGVLRLLRGEEFTPLERPHFGPDGVIRGVVDDVDPRDDFFACGGAGNALLLELDAVRRSPGVEN